MFWMNEARSSGLISAAAAAKSIQSCPALCDPIDGSPPGSSVPGILQARTLEWVAISFSRGSSWPRDWTCVYCASCIAGGFFTTKPPDKPHYDGHISLFGASQVVQW